MSSYKEVLKHAQRRMEEADRGEQAALLYLLELTNMEAHNLYMEFEQEMSVLDVSKINQRRSCKE